MKLSLETRVLIQRWSIHTRHCKIDRRRRLKYDITAGMTLRLCDSYYRFDFMVKNKTKFIRLYFRNLSCYISEIYPVIYQKFIRLYFRNLSGYISEIYPVIYQKFIRLYIRNLKYFSYYHNGFNKRS